MTLLAYPTAVLPLPSKEGFGIEPGENIDRTPMATGPARQRQVFTQVPNQISIRLKFTQWQYGIFDGWYKRDAKRGEVYFTIPLLSGLGVVDHKARFMGQPKAVPQGAFFIVTAKLEVDDPPSLDGDLLSVALVEPDIPSLIATIYKSNTFIQATLAGPDGWV